MKKIHFSKCHFNDLEYKTDRIGKVVPVRTWAIWKNEIKLNLFKDKDIALASSILPRLIRLKDEYNNGWKPNYNENTVKYTIVVDKGKITPHYTHFTQTLLIFEKEETRDFFLKMHRDLIEQTKPLL